MKSESIQIKRHRGNIELKESKVERERERERGKSKK